MTSAADPGPQVTAELDRLVGRLRRLSPREWARDGREPAVRAAAAELAALVAPERSLPDVPQHALGDAVAVLGSDALAVVPADEVRRIVSAALDATR